MLLAFTKGHCPKSEERENGAENNRADDGKRISRTRLSTS